MSVTPLYAGLLALLFLALSVRIMRLRTRLQVGIGDGGDEALARAVRVQGNFVEYVPLALLLMLFVEAAGVAPVWAVHAMGAVLLAARVAHAVGLSGSAGLSAGRAIGVVGTLAVLVAGAAWSILIGLGLG